MVPSVSNAESTYALEFLACPYAALAANATAVILNDRRIEHVDGIFVIRHQVQEHMVTGKHLGSKSLQLTNTVLVTLGTISVMLR